jgi:hypothetical protein
MADSGRWTSNGGDPSLNEINRADRFFEALASKQPVYSTDPAEAELAFLFAEFRDDVRDAPVTAPVSAGDAVEALRGGLAKTRGSRRGFAIVGSVAAAMLCIGGFGTAVYGAGPGDSLYGMRTAIFGQQEQTRDDQVSLASAQLQQVQQLIDQGQWQQAQDKLVQVSSAVQGVDQVESKQQLVEQWNALTYKVVEQNPAATLPPGEPLPVLPSSPLTWLPVPVVEAPTSESTETSQTSQTSETTTTSDTSGATVPPETVMTAPPDSSTSSTTAASDGSSAPATPPSTTPTTLTAPASSPPSSPTTATTTSTVAAELPQATLPPSTPAVPSVVPSTSTVAESPASPPRTAPSSSAAQPPAVSAAPSASVPPSPPAVSTAPERPSVATTTTIVPQSGGVS